MLVENQSQLEAKSNPSDAVRVIQSSAWGLLGFILIYLLLLGLYLRFPYLRPGDNLVADFKHSTARKGNFFKTPKGEALHVMAFGYSKMLAGFKPDSFDHAMQKAGFPKVESYNFGLPGDSRFVEDLEAMANHGTAPDLALLTFPWPAALPPAPTIFHFINNDQELMTRFFPFHHLPRNFFILLTEAHGFRHMGEVYQRDKQAVLQVEDDRGYYFIARQSHYANNQLPADFHLANDKPASLSPRPVTLGPVYQQLAATLAQHKIHCLFIPSYFREGEFAQPPPVNPATANLLAGQPNVAIVGPDYWLYPNRLFSDPVHANKTGAETYTTDLAALVAHHLRQPKGAQP